MYNSNNIDSNCIRVHVVKISPTPTPGNRNKRTTTKTNLQKLWKDNIANNLEKVSPPSVPMIHDRLYKVCGRRNYY